MLHQLCFLGLPALLGLPQLHLFLPQLGLQLLHALAVLLRQHPELESVEEGRKAGTVKVWTFTWEV